MHHAAGRFADADRVAHRLPELDPAANLPVEVMIPPMKRMITIFIYL